MGVRIWQFISGSLVNSSVEIERISAGRGGGILEAGMKANPGRDGIGGIPHSYSLGE